MISHDDKDLRYGAPSTGGHNVIESGSDDVTSRGEPSRGDAPASQVDETFRHIVSILRGAFERPRVERAPMTPDRVKAIREGLQLSQSGLAQVLRLGPSGKRTVARWEAGDNPVPGPVTVALEALEAGWCPGDQHWSDMRTAYLSVLDAIESAVLQAREHVRNTGGR